MNFQNKNISGNHSNSIFGRKQSINFDYVPKIIIITFQQHQAKQPVPKLSIIRGNGSLIGFDESNFQNKILGENHSDSIFGSIRQFFEENF